MNRWFPLVAAGALLLAACASTESVTGRMQQGDETFSGTISGSARRGATGELVLVSSRRTTCRGNFTFITVRRGNGVLNCDDGRSGPFFLSNGNEAGSGYGDLSGGRFTFTFSAAP